MSRENYLPLALSGALPLLTPLEGTLLIALLVPNVEALRGVACLLVAEASLEDVGIVGDTLLLERSDVVEDAECGSGGRDMDAEEEEAMRRSLLLGSSLTLASAASLILCKSSCSA